jgi:hypothetical protein
MKQYRCLFLLLLVFFVSGQTRVDIQKQGKGSEFLAPPFAKPIRTGATLPATCLSGELFFLIGAPAGGNLHVCHSNNQWAPQGSAGQANLTVLSDGNLVGTRTAANFTAGTGILQILADSGASVDILQAADTAVLATKSALQAGQALACRSTATSSPSAFSCGMMPVLGAYTQGMVVHWIPDVDPAGGALTLDVDALGPKPVRMADGVSNPAPGDFRAGGLYPLWFDGTQFRVLAPLPVELLTESELQQGTATACISASASPTAYSCSLSPSLQAYTPGMVIRWRPDVDAGEGPLTLNVNALGPIPIRQSDGISEPNRSTMKASRMFPLWFDGAVFRTLFDPPDPTLVNAATLQSAQPLHCLSFSGSDSAYTCELNPALAAYTTGMVLYWRPDVSGSGGPTTLDVGALGPRAVKLADGLTDPLPGDFAAGRLYPLWYDGARFRVISEIVPANNAAPRPACSADLRGQTWYLPGGAGEKDSYSICAKDEVDLYEWRSIF